MGRRYLETRSCIQSTLQLALTSLYNRFHDEAEQSSDFRRLREAHQNLDSVVAASYGISFPLEHGFHDTKQGRRFTISPTARREVIRHLLMLNREHYEEEVAQGLYGSVGGASLVTPRARRAAETVLAQPSLDFGSPRTTTAQDGSSAAAILDFLRAHHGWHAKSDVLAATGITDGQWNSSITNLISGGRVERQGEKRGARYRIFQGGGK
ncbi:MAG: hypothetical protein ACOYLN_16580 [Blastocatellia bacterium]